MSENKVSENKSQTKTRAGKSTSEQPPVSTVSTGSVDVTNMSAYLLRDEISNIIDLAISKSQSLIKAQLTQLIEEGLSKIYERLDSIEAALKKLERDYDGRIKDVEQHLNNLTENQFRMKANFELLRKETSEAMKLPTNNLSKEVHDATVIANNNDQYSRRFNLRVYGLTLGSDANSSQCSL